MTPVIDLHCDLPVYLMMNPQATPDTRAMGAGIPFLKEGHVKLQTMAIYTGVEEESSREGLQQALIYRDMLNQHSTDFFQAGPGFEDADSGRIGIVAALESASGICNESEPLENAFKNLEEIIKNVQRLFYISLTHHDENRFGGGNYSKPGLKPDGQVLLDYISGRQIAIDLSHTSDALAHDILDYTYSKNLDVPVIASHSNFREIWDHPRNLTKENALEIINRNGLIGMNFLRAFLNDDRPEALYEHIEYGMALAGGEDALCFGADFFYTGDFPDPKRDPYYFPEHEDASKYPEILKTLGKRISEKQIEKLACKNVMSFIASNWN